MKLNCIIVDDEPVARKILQEYVEDIDFLQIVGMAENPLKANSLLLSEKVDLMFLDINMPKMSGIDFLKTGSRLPLTILTTAYSDYALEGFELYVLDYLVKPFSADRFLKACMKAKEYYELKNGTDGKISNLPGADYCFVKCDGRIEKVFFDELIYVEAMMNYIILHTETRKLIVYLTIKSILEQLPPEMFLKIHKSTIINIKKVKSIEGNSINLGKTNVVISQNLQDSAMKAILKNRLFKR